MDPDIWEIDNTYYSLSGGKDPKLMKLLGLEIYFRANIGHSVRRYSIWWVILLVTIVFDIFTTHAFVSKYGIKAEGNMATRTWMLYAGPGFGNIIGKLLQFFSVVFFAGLHKRLGNIFLLLIILLNCWAIVINSMSLAG